MFILRDLLRPLQAHFSDTALGQERAALLAYTLLVIIVPFTSSMTSNCLRCLEALFRIAIKKKRFYPFMASSTLPWQKLWRTTLGFMVMEAIDAHIQCWFVQVLQLDARTLRLEALEINDNPALCQS
ncbi:MAG: hypothetical protein PHH11_02420 [Methylomonas sp.]|nr:hypothetical protein [Methylomonas sp.]